MTEQEWLVSDDPRAMLHHLQDGSRHDHGTGRTQRFYAVSNRRLRLFACACCRHVWDRLTDPRSRLAVEVAEQYAEGEEVDIWAPHFGAFNAADGTGAHGVAWLPVWATAGRDGGMFEANTRYRLKTLAENGLQSVTQAALLRDIAGNPWWPVTLPLGWEPCPDCVPGQPDDDCDDCAGLGCLPAPCPWLRWHDGLILRLAQAAYDERLPDGTLDPGRLDVLADSLEDAGVEGVECPQCDGKGWYWTAKGSEEAWKEDCEGCVNGRTPHPILAHLRSPGPHVRGCWVVDLLTGRS